jgi:hypothetical protein
VTVGDGLPGSLPFLREGSSRCPRSIQFPHIVLPDGLTTCIYGGPTWHSGDWVNAKIRYWVASGYAVLAELPQ